MNMNGLMAGLGQGFQMAGAMQWERAKQERLETIRKQERVERREDARLDREARMKDARTLAQEERDNAGTWEQVLGEEGNVIAQRHSVTGETKPLELGKNDEIKRVYQNSVDLVQDAFTQYGDVEAMPESIKGRVENALAIVTAYESRFLPEGAGGAGGGAGGAGGGGNKDKEIAAAIGDPTDGGADKTGAPDPDPDPMEKPPGRPWRAPDLLPNTSAAFGRAVFGDNPDGSLGGLLGWGKGQLQQGKDWIEEERKQGRSGLPW